MKTHVELQIDGDIGQIVLRPDPDTKPPAFDQHSIVALDEVVTRMQQVQHSLRAAILVSESEKHFLVGANIKALAALTADTMPDWVRQGHQVFNRLEKLPIPVIARVEGNALGGGLELAMACDLIVAGPNARFGLPEPRLGLITGWGGAWRLKQRIGQAAARQLLFTGKIIGSVQARQFGLCDFLGSKDELNTWTDAFVRDVREMSWESIAETKEMLLAFDDAPRRQSCEIEAAASQRLMASPATADRLQAFFERRK